MAISKKMLINVIHPEEARVAIVHDGRLMELNVEITGKEQIKGNIYKGVVLRVEQGLQAAFVDIGREKPGFLQMGELHPDLWQRRDNSPQEERNRRPRIQDVLRRGQELIVQVEKDERDNKGAALTTYLSLPGRYMVIMPGNNTSGISRKVEKENIRRELKETAAAMEIPEGIGYIIRTEAVGRNREELQKDLDNLVAMYREISEKGAGTAEPGEVYRDSGLIIRFLRDYFSDDIDEILVDSKDAWREAKDFFRNNMPKYEKLVKLHREKRPIFSRFQLEEQLDQIYEKRVPLSSGGYLIIEPTEALVSIDVNSGKTSGERGVEDTAFRTNMEAAEEVARQLRLRDLGGLIVIDFIDMRDKKHNHEVERTLKDALKMDKARVNIGRISEFGILEMSRQRIAKTLNDAIHLECPHCEGRGKVKSVEAMAVSFLRKVHAAAAKGTVSEVHGGLPLEVAYYLLNRKKRELAQIENDYDIIVTVKGKTSFLLNQLELATVKREKQPQPDFIDPDAKKSSNTVKDEKNLDNIHETEATGETTADEETISAESSKKKKRRRKKKRNSALTSIIESEPATAEAGESEVDSAPAELELLDESEKDKIPAEQPDASGKPKKRRRKRSRKPVKNLETEASAGETPQTAVQAVAENEINAHQDTAPLTEPDGQPEMGGSKAVKKTKPGENLGTRKKTADELPESGGTDMDAGKKKKTKRKPATAGQESETSHVTPSEPISEPTRKKRGRKTEVSVSEPLTQTDKIDIPAKSARNSLKPANSRKTRQKVADVGKSEIKVPDKE